ncbi:tRNA lysidine(34) synthetase [Desulfogranum japonicum]|uniref:tRNA lysidine(34) synthetase n=1 Tax=Desulfogranum japonicum TaxID=231447 RepID=UPI001427B1FF|nr:tRNA 2-thiocytidine biosynthesis TtcA family protein [Desulfogranum japonicum]
MHDYSMLAEGDSVLVAVSGGIDSLVLAWVLTFWEKKAPIHYSMECVHVDMEGTAGELGTAAYMVKQELANLGIPLTVLPARWHPDRGQLNGSETENVCFQCSRSRRKQLFDHAASQGHCKLALGHHRDDIIETFFLNLTCAGNISTMRPRQQLFSGKLNVIRPLAYCDKGDVETIGRMLHCKPVRSSCPLSEKTRRADIHKLVRSIYAALPDSKEHIFAALGNVREDYMLLPDTRKP